MEIQCLIHKKDILQIFRKLKRLAGKGYCHIKVRNGYLKTVILETEEAEGKDYGKLKLSSCLTTAQFRIPNFPDCEFVLHDILSLYQIVRRLGNIEYMLIIEVENNHACKLKFEIPKYLKAEAPSKNGKIKKLPRLEMSASFSLQSFTLRELLLMHGAGLRDIYSITPHEWVKSSKNKKNRTYETNTDSVD